MPSLVRSNLQLLIIVLAFFSALISMVNLFYMGYQVQKKALLEHSLDTHQAYATKLASIAHLFLQRAQSELYYCAKKIGETDFNTITQNEELERLMSQSRTFDTLFIANSQGQVTAASEKISALLNLTLESSGIHTSLRLKAPFITAPYHSALDNPIIMISEPIFSPTQDYLGFISAAIYLKENELLHEILGEHFHQDDSYTYVINRQKRLLYHPNHDLVGQLAPNSAIDQLFEKGSGSEIFTNEEGVEMLGGFAVIPDVDWLVVSQRPVKSTLQVHEGLMLKVFIKSIPITVVMLLIIWFLAKLVTNPLRQLAQQARKMRQTETLQQVQKINTWYFEANELKKAFLTGLQSVHRQVGQLKLDTRTDMLTGLNNRRALDSILANLTKSQTPFAILAIDIDHFKQVNDTHGHLVGDEVLKDLATILASNIRSDDHCIRLGGEEFVILLPKCSVPDAKFFAERLRLIISQHSFPTIDHLTISCGIAVWPLHANTTEAVFKLADQMLYQAKQNGRNQVQAAT